MRSPLTKGIILFPVFLLVGAASTGIAGAGNKGSSGTEANAQKTSSQAMITAAGRGAVVPPRMADIEQMCAMLLGCRDLPIQLPTKDFGLCVRHFGKRLSSPEALKSSLTIRECGLGAVSCGQFVRCALRGAEPDDCRGRGMGASEPVGRCDLSGRALQCLNGKLVGVRDCPRGGELCAARNGEADCVSGRCSVKAGKDAKPVCSADKTRISTCKNGRTVSMSCAAMGLRCEDTGGGPKCVPASARACTGQAERCDGSTAVKCVDGREVRVQCTEANLVCGVGTTDESRIGACAMSPYSGDDNECDPKKFVTRCRGNAVQYCVGGRRRTYNCKTYFGMNRCEGQPGQAHCAR